MKENHLIYTPFVRARYFLIPYLGCLLGLGWVLWATDQRELHLAINQVNAYGSDGLMQIATYLGDRRVAWLAGGLLLCSRRFREGGAVLLATISAGLFTELLKYGVLGDHPRPVALFSEPSALLRVPGFENHLEYSMPSGHTAIAFALFLSLALQRASRWQQVGLLGLALVAGFSRIYLSEHFLEDVYAGSLLGVVCALIAALIVRPAVWGVRPMEDDVAGGLE